jgi:hypothetical protein
VPVKRRRLPIAFALSAVLAILALFVLDGPAGGVAALAAMLVFILACIGALGREDVDVRRRSDRTGLTGWVGGWF